MKFSRTDADVYVPDGESPEAVLARLTHLCIAAHQDDIEIMATDAIVECLGSPDRAFGGVVVTDGAGSPRTGEFESMSDAEMIAVRRKEQRRAAKRGRYALQVQLGHPSADVKAAAKAAVRSDLGMVLSACRPRVLYLHNPADKHDTHVAVLLRCVEALRTLPPANQPDRVLGCEVWRGLDWLNDDEKVGLDAGRDPKLAATLLRAFKSQIGGGKRYDAATLGRRTANATFHQARVPDGSSAIVWAMDLTPLVRDPGLSVEAFTLGAVDRFRQDVADRLRRLG